MSSKRIIRAQLGRCTWDHGIIVEIDFCPSLPLVAASLVVGKWTDGRVSTDRDICITKVVEICGSMP